MNMPSSELALPFTGMMILTMAVWIYMFIQRMGAMTANNIDIEEMKTPPDTDRLIPADASSAGNNFKNLFETPVLFYALCIYLMLSLQVDDIHIYCAWAFLIFRVLHSAIHCTYNRVAHRFGAYAVASIALWVMVVRAFLGAL